MPSVFGSFLLLRYRQSRNRLAVGRFGSASATDSARLRLGEAEAQARPNSFLRGAKSTIVEDEAIRLGEAEAQARPKKKKKTELTAKYKIGCVTIYNNIIIYSNRQLIILLKSYINASVQHVRTWYSLSYNGSYKQNELRASSRGLASKQLFFFVYLIAAFKRYLKEINQLITVKST
jgi:hypothetical protein